jgi:hypothetical protein
LAEPHKLLDCGFQKQMKGCANAKMIEIAEGGTKEWGLD